MLKILRQDSIIQYKKVHSYTQETNIFYSHLEIFICIYSVRGEIDQISTIHSDIQPAAQQMFTCLFTPNQSLMHILHIL